MSTVPFTVIVTALERSAPPYTDIAAEVALPLSHVTVSEIEAGIDSAPTLIVKFGNSATSNTTIKIEAIILRVANDLFKDYSFLDSEARKNSCFTANC
jgi:hypothetical protein